MALDIQQVETTARQLRKFLKKSDKRPSASQIHKLRSRTRRFHAALDALGLSSRGGERRLLRDLERLRKRAGKVRDMDVLTAYVTGIEVDASEKECLVSLLQHLGAQRYRHAAKLNRAVRGKRATVKRRLKQVSEHLGKLESHASSASFHHDGSSADAMVLTLDLSTDLEKPAVLNQKNLHPYRLRVKELRYVLQLADAPTEREFIAKLKEVQSAIGEWHDWIELIDIAREVLDHGNRCKFVYQLQSISQRKYQSALSVTNAMRKHYLGLKNGKKPAQTPNSVLRAMSSMAA